jgi:hypothetical protein
MDDSPNLQNRLLTDSLRRYLVDYSVFSLSEGADNHFHCTSFLSSELWLSLPSSLQFATYETWINFHPPNTSRSKFFFESLITYNLVTEEDRAEVLARRVCAEHYLIKRA